MSLENYEKLNSIKVFAEQNHYPYISIHPTHKTITLEFNKYKKIFEPIIEEQLEFIKSKKKMSNGGLVKSKKKNNSTEFYFL
jgi:hypothetical protein